MMRITGRQEDHQSGKGQKVEIGHRLWFQRRWELHSLSVIGQTIAKKYEKLQSSTPPQSKSMNTTRSIHSGKHIIQTSCKTSSVKIIVTVPVKILVQGWRVFDWFSNFGIT